MGPSSLLGDVVGEVTGDDSTWTLALHRHTDRFSKGNQQTQQDSPAQPQQLMLLRVLGSALVAACTPLVEVARSWHQSKADWQQCEYAWRGEHIETERYDPTLVHISLACPKTAKNRQLRLAKENKTADEVTTRRTLTWVTNQTGRVCKPFLCL